MKAQRLEQQIRLLTERRQVLISAAVPGQIDVARLDVPHR
ncbi:MAG: type I restriction endonuclease subunit S [Chloroflexota bacterium]